MTVRRVGSVSAVLVFVVAALVGRAAGSASPASSAPGDFAAAQASPAGESPGVQRLGSPVATAASATATAETAEDIPSPFECDVDAVGFLHLLGIASELQDESSLDPDPTRIERDRIRGGQQVSPEDYQGILDTTRELVACVNAEEPLKVAALLSDRFLARLSLDLLNGEGGITELLNNLPALAQQVDPEQDFAMIPITAAWYPDLPDKTIFAILEPHVEGLDEQRQFLVVFTYEKHRWLIEAMVLVDG